MVVERSLGSWDGEPADALASRCGVPVVLAYPVVPSTMDVAHRLGASGGVAGTLVLAEAQESGRGRGGHQWATAPATTLALSLLERPADPAAVGVLSLRIGLAAARVLATIAPDVLVKWPNDLMRATGKVGGVLIEARWRGSAPDWVVIGLGLNVSEAPFPGAASLAFPGRRTEILALLVPALRAAVAQEGTLGPSELAEWRRFDWGVGRHLVAPARGVARGIDAEGNLVVDAPAGPVRCSSGSLILAED